MARSNYAGDVVTALASGVGSLTAGTNLFQGPLRSVSESFPHKAVFVLETGGASPINFCDNSASPQIYSPSVQITVRSDPNDFSSGWTLATAVYAAIHDVPPSGYISARVATSGILYLGPYDNGEHLWSINVDLLKCE